ncbi:MAG: FAD binding domain-containing protein [Gammaproteobacteria bacterium]
MNNFDFHRPATVADAAKLIAGAPDGKLLGGGQSLLASMKLGLAAPSDLVDLSQVGELRGIRVEGGSVRIGAMTSHADVAASAEVQRAIPALAALAAGIGDRAVRTLGTIGGSLANNDPAACYPAAVLGLGATVHTEKRTIAADDFFKGLYETALEPNEIVTAVSFPVPAKAAYVKFRQPASRFALVGVFVSQGPSGVRVAVTGAGPSVFRVAALEQALAAGWSAAACAGVSVPAEGLNSDLHASAEYRAHLIPVLAGRAVAQAG